MFDDGRNPSDPIGIPKGPLKSMAVCPGRAVSVLPGISYCEVTEGFQCEFCVANRVSDGYKD